MASEMEDELINRSDPMLALRKASRITAVNGTPDAAGIEAATPMRGEMPTDPAFLKSLGKPVSEILGMIFHTPPTGQEIPSMLRVTNWNAVKGTVALHGGTKAGPEFHATPAELDTMIENGMLSLKQPAIEAGDRIRRLLQGVMK